jgi:hypothetical protein
MKTDILFLSLIVFGCSSTVQNLPEESDGGTAGISAGGNETGGIGGISAGGNETGGIGGISTGGTGGVCIPITCVTFGVRNDGEACGFVDDGCGNFIDCGGCSNPRKGCLVTTHGNKLNICNDLCYHIELPEDPFNPPPEIIMCDIICSVPIPEEVWTNCNGQTLCPCSEWE